MSSEMGKSEMACAAVHFIFCSFISDINGLHDKISGIVQISAGGSFLKYSRGDTPVSAWNAL